LKIGGSYMVPVDQERAYGLLLDPDVLARCMPGCERLVKTGEGEYGIELKMLISSIQGLFTGKVRVADQNPPDGFRLIVEGSGKVGFMKGDGRLNLVPGEDGATEIRYEGEVQVGGAIAAVGQRLLDSTSKFIIKKFFQKLSESAAKASSGAVP
jgi:uncharacterized protein